MKWIKTILTTLVILPVLTLNGANSPDDGLLLYAPFDGSVNAAFARGEATGTAAVTPEFHSGLRGQALVIGGIPEDRERIVDELPAHADGVGRNVYFDSDGNIDVERGTLSFWLKPLDWSGADGGFNVFFRTHVGRRQYFMLYKFFHSQRLRMIIGEDGKWTSTEERIGDWRPGQWRHLAVTWSPAEQRLFVDGRLVKVLRRRFPLDASGPVEPLSVGPGGSWAKGFIGHSLIDEFRIHDRPLSDSEIVALYRLDADAALLESGHVTVGKRTPVLDGRIDADEYPLDATGFNDLRGVAARQQSRYALSYDEENLYVAVRSEAAAASPAIGDHSPIDNRQSTIEIFLCPTPGRDPLLHLVFMPDGKAFAGGADSGAAAPETIRVAQSIEDGIWTLESAIPFAALGRTTPADGDVWRFNLGRVFDTETHTSVAPVIGTLADRAKFMELRFRPDAPEMRVASLFDLEAHRLVLDVTARSTDPDIRIDAITVSSDVYDRSEGTFTHRVTLVEPDRGQPMEGSAPLRDVQYYTLQMAEVRDGVDATLLHKRFLIRDERLPMMTQFFYTLDRRQLSVSAERRANGWIRVRFQDESGAEVWRVRQPIPEEATFFDAVFDLDFDVLLPGLYRVKIDHVASDGTETETYSQAYRIPGPDHPAFHPYVDPEADQVPAPWTPVEVSGFGVQGSGDGEHRTEASTVDVQPSTFILHPSSFQISTWGRTYGFGEGFLFDSLISQGEQVLAAPAALRLDGELLAPVGPVETEPGEATDLRAALVRRADLGALTVESRIVTHFDGYCEIEMTLIPPADGIEIGTLTLEIPLLSAAATLVRDAIIAPLSGSKSGALGDTWQQRLIHQPFFWVGNDRVGFNWLAPSLEHWHCRHNDRNVEMTRDADILRVTLNLVDTPLRLDAPRTIPFGFTLTPTRPLDRRVLRRRESKEYASMSQPWKYFAVPEYDTARPGPLENALRRAEPDADQVFVYNGTELFSPFHPDWGFFEEEWRGLTRGTRFGEWTGGHTDPVTRDAATYVWSCRRCEGFVNAMQHRFSDFFARAAERPIIPQATGYYFDTGAGASECLNRHHAGCGTWTGLDGREYGRLPIDETREYWLNLYRMIRRTGPENVIYYHLGWTRVMPLMTFTDMICGGEGVTGQTVRSDGTYNYFDFLTPELFRATFSPYLWGVKMVFIDMTLRALRETHQAAYAAWRFDNPDHRRPLMHSYGYCLAHDVDVWDRHLQSLPMRRTIWAAQDALGWDEDVIFHPYWENDAVKRLGDDIDRIMASAYTKDGRMILVVVNDTDEDREVDLALDLEALGMQAGGEGYDVWDTERRYQLGAEWRDTVPAREFRMVVWK